MAFASCEKMTEGDITSRDFGAPGSYTALEVSNAFDAYVSNTANVITVTAGENVMPYVVVETVNNTLKIYLKPMAIVNVTELKVVLPYNANLTHVDLSGASSFHSEYMLQGSAVEVKLSGASAFHCDLDADNISIGMSGASVFLGDAVGDQIDMDLSGSSEFFGDLTANEIEAELSGSSRVTGEVLTANLDLDMTGASDASLVGVANNLTLDLSGASDILRNVIDHRYGLVCDRCEGELSGASTAHIHCDGTILVHLSGASVLRYSGDANTTGSTVDGGSEIFHDVF